MTKSTKSVLIKEMETHLKPEDYNYDHRSNAEFIIDVTANIWKVQVAKMSTFNGLLSGFLSFTAKCHEFGRCYYVFDMYSNAPSVKDGERKKRCDKVSTEYSSIEISSPLPQEIGTFWPSNSNKLLVENKLFSVRLRQQMKSCNAPKISKVQNTYNSWCLKRLNCVYQCMSWMHS